MNGPGPRLFVHSNGGVPVLSCPLHIFWAYSWGLKIISSLSGISSSEFQQCVPFLLTSILLLWTTVKPAILALPVEWLSVGSSHWCDSLYWKSLMSVTCELPRIALSLRQEFTFGRFSFIMGHLSSWELNNFKLDRDVLCRMVNFSQHWKCAW